MAEMTIQLTALELMAVIREHYDCPGDTVLKLEVLINDETEYPGSEQNEFAFRLSDGNRVTGFSESLIFEYDLKVGHENQGRRADIINKMVTNLREEFEVKSVYKDIM